MLDSRSLWPLWEHGAGAAVILVSNGCLGISLHPGPQNGSGLAACDGEQQTQPG